MAQQDNIILIGFMGSGKTSVARKLHDLSGWVFLDTDQFIEQQSGLIIPHIFEKKGELFFRDTETACLKELLSIEKTILATGGGIVLRSENQTLLKQMGKVFWLTAEPVTILTRVKNNLQRPLLKGKQNTADITNLLLERKPFYQSVADYIIDTEQKSVWEIAQEILGIYQHER